MLDAPPPALGSKPTTHFSVDSAALGLFIYLFHFWSHDYLAFGVVRCEKVVLLGWYRAWNQGVYVCWLRPSPEDSWGGAIKDTSTPFSEVLYSSPGGVARVFKASVQWDCLTFTEHLKYSASLIASIISISEHFP